MKKGYEVGDYLRVWTVLFAEKFASGERIFSSRTVAAHSVDEALRKARGIERKGSRRISLKVLGVSRGDVLDG